MTEMRQLVIVRRHKLAAFAMLAQAFADEPGVRLTWDRRLRERRQASTPVEPEGRRRRDRRCAKWTTWDRADYLFVSVAEAGTAEAEAIVRPDTGCNEHTCASEEIQRDIKAAVNSDLAVLISRGDPVSRISLAHQIHRRSGRSGRPLFVVERDALIEFFQGFDAGVPLPGRIVDADTRHAPWAKGIEGGTLLIEEIADLSLEEQSKLLLFLECAVQRNDRRPPGIGAPRIMTGTSHWLLDRVASKQFRADLFYRLNAIHLVLPSGSVRTCG